MRLLLIGLLATLTSSEANINQDFLPDPTTAVMSLVHEWDDPRDEGSAGMVCATCPNTQLLCFFALAEPGHTAVSAGYGMTDPHDDCVSDAAEGGTCAGHTYCLSPARSRDEVARLEHLTILAANGDRRAAVSLLVNYQDAVEYIPERSALRIANCGGGTIGFFPIDSDLLADARVVAGADL